MPSRRMLILVVAGLVVLVGGDRALAWGPATHIEIANEVLRHLNLLPAAVGALLSRYAYAYLYGTVAADVVFAKRLSRIRQFCHHWTTAFEVLERAEEDDTRAFAWGYLSHLAADTVAHGKYVPRQITISNTSMNVGHLYWELRADAMAGSEAWRSFSTIMAQDHDAHHRLLATRLKGALLPYEVNRFLFHGINTAILRPLPRQAMGRVSALSRFRLSADLMKRYHAESVDRTLTLLTEGTACALLHEDPNGTTALMQTRINRRRLKRLRMRGQVVDGYVREMAASFAPDV